jgi:hypothetical protein
MWRIEMNKKAQQLKLAALVLTYLLAASPINGASLRSETIDAWEHYVNEVNLRVSGELQSDATFLSLDADPRRREKVRRGEILAAPMTPNTPLAVQHGLIHDWNGAAFVPGARLSAVMHVIRDYPHYRDIYKPGVVDSAALELSENEDRFFLLLANQPLIGQESLETDYKAHWFRRDECHAYAFVVTTRIQEVAEDGNHRRGLPENQGSGLIWRLYATTRLEERDGGVYVEIETMALSRDIPAALRWFVEPIVRRVSRSSLAISLHQTRDAVLRSIARSTRGTVDTPRYLQVDRKRGISVSGELLADKAYHFPISIALPGGSSRREITR